MHGCSPNAKTLLSSRGGMGSHEVGSPHARLRVKGVRCNACLGCGSVTLCDEPYTSSLGRSGTVSPVTRQHTSSPLRTRRVHPVNGKCCGKHCQRGWWAGPNTTRGCGALHALLPSTRRNARTTTHGVCSLCSSYLALLQFLLPCLYRNHAFGVAPIGLLQ